MLNGVTMKINVDDYIINTLKEDITSEDVSTNAVMPEDKQGRAASVGVFIQFLEDFRDSHILGGLRKDRQGNTAVELMSSLHTSQEGLSQL